MTNEIINFLPKNKELISSDGQSKLNLFFLKLSTIKQNSSLTNKLVVFFDELNDFKQLIKPTPVDRKYDLGTLRSKLTGWFTDIQEPLNTARSGGFLFDPWDVAGLRHDEVRNSRVLAWILDPKGSHGLGSLALNELLKYLKKIERHEKGRLPLPDSITECCKIRVESNPDGHLGTRVDIEIHDPGKVYLIIEVKIKATEGERQLEKYGDLCKARLEEVPWRIVFLTVDGKKSTSAGQNIFHVISISWAKLSRLLKVATNNALQEKKTRTKAQHAIEFSIIKFFNHIKTLHKRK